MYIMPSSCFNNSAKSIASPIKQPTPSSLPQTPTKAQAKTTDSNDDDNNIFEKFIIDNPLIFRICCLCLSRRRKRVDTAIVNGNGNVVHNPDDTVLTIDQIEFTRSTIALNEE